MTFTDECIESHNRYRAKHGAEPLKHKQELADHAQHWANYLSRTGRFSHSRDSNFGENIAMTSKSYPTGEEITKMWYDEIAKYRFSKPGFTAGTGHFTQLVWRSTTHIGIGIARGASGTYVVANYEPAGNTTNPGYFERNVRPLSASASSPSPTPRRPSSSSSSSGDEKRYDFDKMVSEDKKKRLKKSKSSPGGSTETKVDTKVREFTDAQGRRVRETTTTTTTITKRGIATSTSTKTDVKTEYLSGGGSAPSASAGSDDRLVDSFRNTSLSDDKKETKELSKSEKKKFREECVNRHNELRKRHAAPPLEQSKSLNKKAQKWAKHLLAIRRLEHSDDRDFGENVAYKFASDTRICSGADIADMWYNEIEKYDFNKPGFKSGTGHFTQVVWESSKEIGVGVAIDGRGTIFAVANYTPAGNFMGRFEQNVKKPRK